MKKQTKTTRPWHPIEAAIVAHVARYGVTTAAALFALGLKGVKDHEQACERLSALVRKGDLVRHQVAADEACFSLSTAAVARTKELGVQAPVEVRSADSLTRAYALLAACCLQQEKRKLLTNTELTAHFPDLRSDSQLTRYYLSREAEQIRLGFVRIDRGGRGRWDRIVRKACDDMRKHLSVLSLRPMIGKQQFEICIVTALPCKAKKIDALLREQQKLLNVPYRVISIPRLINFIRPPPD
jgi:hypothetical protein